MAPQAEVEPVRVRVLGSLRLGEDDGAPLQSARLRRLFAVLLVHRGMAVPAGSPGEHSAAAPGTRPGTAGH